MREPLAEMASAQDGEYGAADEDRGVDAGNAGKEGPLQPGESEGRESKQREEGGDEADEKADEHYH
jgi:hypothetical protein